MDRNRIVVMVAITLAVTGAIAWDRDQGADRHRARVLGRQRHRGIDVRAEQLRIVEPCVREAGGLGDLAVASGVPVRREGDAEVHRGCILPGAR